MVCNEEGFRYLEFRPYTNQYDTLLSNSSLCECAQVLTASLKAEQ